MAWEGCYGAGVTVQVLRCRWYGAGVARCGARGAVMRDELELCCTSYSCVARVAALLVLLLAQWEDRGPVSMVWN
jgi:hypothetical protein